MSYQSISSEQPTRTTGRPILIHHTTVNISRETPKDYLPWSLFNYLCCNIMCIGLIALILSIKTRDLNEEGDMEGAHRFGSGARTYNIVATAVGSIVWLFILIAILTVVLGGSKTGK